MKERPILFSAPMVRSMLAGTKTQTRRVVKPVRFFPDYGRAVGRVGGAWKYGSPAALGLRERGDYWSVLLEGDVLQRMCAREAYGWGAGAGCPYGVPGDRLWVKETIVKVGESSDHVYSAYKADEHLTVADAWPWKRDQLNSIHCPRGLSRILLEVTEIHVERLQDISEADAIAEGIKIMTQPPEHGGRTRYGTDSGLEWLDTARDAYRELWESINGLDSWAANPFVWVVTFKRISS